ncbi:MAG: response regulator [Treponema sp.]|nr:response regulator [Treponema sp.]
MVKILVVDDSIIMRNIVKNTFASLKVPFDCLEAENGNQALQLLESNNITIVFLDWNMEGMDGIEFLKVVRAMPKYKSLPIVMVTSEKGKFSVIKALKSGATDYIVKPVIEKVFKNKVTELLVLARD